MASPTMNPSASTAGRVVNAELYRTIARELPQGAVFVVDANLRYLLADGSGLRTAGFEPSHFEGRTVREAMPSDMAELYEADCLGVLAGQPFSREHEVNGRHYRSHGIPLHDESGRPELALVVSYDITDRVHAERRLRLLGELGEIVRAATDHVHTVDAVSDLLRRHLGCAHCLVAEVDAAQAQIAELSSVLGTCSLAAIQPLSILGPGIVQRLLDGQPVSAGQPGGAPGCALLVHTGMATCHACPRMRDGRLVGIFVVLEDKPAPWEEDFLLLLMEVADKTWDAVERCRALAALRASDEHKTRVLAVLGHELRSPLAALTPALQLLQRSPGPPSPGIVRLMERQVSQLNHLVDDLLSLSYIAFGKLELHIERVAVGEIVEAALEAQGPVAERKRQRIELDMPPEPAWLDADRAKLTQVLSNLLGNAIKYTPPDGRITLAVRATHDRLALSVSDNGIGMSREAVAHMFGLFTRGAPDARAHARAHGLAENGLGIGLWVVRQLVLAHGGEVSASSPGEGLGSCFTVELPLAARRFSA
jgi:PAS domain S-box-containing protein